MEESSGMIVGECRFCHATLKHRFIDAFFQSNGKMTDQGQFGDNGHSQIPTYVCQECFLIQTSETSSLSDNQSYLSSFSSTWLVDMNDYVDKIFKKFDLIGNSLSAELVDHRENSLPGTNKDHFFGSKNLHSLIDFYGKADRIDCKSELACVDDINDFMSGIKSFLKSDGIATLHLLPIMEAKHIQASSIGSIPYFSFTTVDKMMKKYEMEIFNVEECFPQGSLRIQVKHYENSVRKVANNVLFIRGRERDLGMSSLNHYTSLKNLAHPAKATLQQNRISLEAVEKEN